MPEKIALIGTNFHGNPDEMNYKIALEIAKAAKEKAVFVSIKTTKEGKECHGGIILPAKSKAGVFAKLTKTILYLRSKGVKVFCFFFVGSSIPNILLIKLIKTIGGKAVLFFSAAPTKAAKHASISVFYSKMDFLNAKNKMKNAFLLEPTSLLPKIKKTKKKNDCLLLSVPFNPAQLKSHGIFDAIKEFGGQKSSFRLVIANRNPKASKEISEKIQNTQHKSNVSIINKSLTEKETAKLITESKILLIPFIGGVFPKTPLSAIEALSFGVPIITTKNNISNKIEEYGAGFEIKSLDEAPKKAQEIDSNYAKFSRNAKKLFESEFPQKKFRNEIKKLVNGMGG